MDTDSIDREIARRSLRLYLPISLGAALLFFLAATGGEYPWVARIGGAVWVGILTLIIAMPVVTSWVKRRARGPDRAAGKSASQAGRREPQG
ncbi:MAG TPA: hypothetical protein VJJ46_08295 [Anaerolineales bacterium]|jgi:hypothetical protein|nr:hypothetical protein [Anaerolineales bacterium]